MSRDISPISRGCKRKISPDSLLCETNRGIEHGFRERFSVEYEKLIKILEMQNTDSRLNHSKNDDGIMEAGFNKYPIKKD